MKQSSGEIKYMSATAQTTTEPQCVVVCEYTACLSRFGEPDPYCISFLETCIKESFPVYVIGQVPVQKIKAMVGSLAQAVHCIGNDSPQTDESCECSAAVCIRNSILPAIGDETAILSVCSHNYGCCIARFSDVVFARDEAAAYCNAEKIPHYPYSTMFDVKRLFTSKVLHGKIHPRNKARLLRKDAFETE